MNQLIREASLSTDIADEAAEDRPSSVYDRIREDIIEGRLPADSRLKVRDLAARYDVSTNPVREALQQLRGEGFVVISPNRGARVQKVDEAFLRDAHEIELLIEPYLTRCFVDIVTDSDIAELEAVQDEIEELNFRDVARASDLDSRFHGLVYERHPNERLREIWWKHRQILGAITKRFPVAISRQAAVIQDHRELIACLKAHDVAGAEAVMVRHVSGSGHHMLQQLRSALAHRSSHR